MQDLKQKHMQKMKEGINKIKNNQHLQEKTAWIMSVINDFLSNNEDHEGQTAQSAIGIECLFRGWITKKWEDANETQPKQIWATHKVIVWYSVSFYAQT